MARKPPSPQLEEKVFRNVDEIDRAIAKLRSRIKDVEEVDFRAVVIGKTGAQRAVESNIKATIREIFGPNSPEYQEHQSLELYGGSLAYGMPDEEIIQGYEQGRTQVITMLNALISRLKEKKDDLGGGPAGPTTYFDKLNLHPRIADVARDLFLDGHHFDAAFAGAKALVNYVKERSGRHDLDGAALVRTVFSKNNPTLAFNDLNDQTDLDEQEGLMHLFEGAVLAIRNPGGHAFPEGTEQRAIEYISLLSLLAYLAQEAKKR